MALSQETRRIRLATPLGTDALGLVRLSATEALSTPFEVEIEAVTDLPDLDFDALLGGNVTVALGTQTGVRHFNGYVSEAELTGPRGSLSGVRFRLAPWLWFLGHRQTCRIFVEAGKVDEIVTTVFEESGFSDFRFDLKRTYQIYEYCVQYNETDLNFVSRLLEQEGIFYYFEHDNGRHTLVLTDDVASRGTMPEYDRVWYEQSQQAGATAEEAVQSWRPMRRVRPTSALVDDFDPLMPDTRMNADTEVVRAHGLAGAQVYEWQSQPGRRPLRAGAQAVADTRAEELQSRAVTVEGEGTVRGLAPGRLFTLEGHPAAAQNAEHMVTVVRHDATAPDYDSGEGEAETYSARFEAIPSTEAFRPARRAPRPRITGHQTAIVTGADGEEIDVDAHGRVLVTFHWLMGTLSCRVRVAQPWAGSGYGQIWIPRIGDEVVVAFESGDPDRPLIVGSVFNGANAPPWTLPDDKTVSGIKTNSSKGGGGFNALRFDDKKDAENVFFHAQKDFDFRAGNLSREWIGNERHAHVEKKEFLNVGEERHEIIGKLHRVSVGEESHLTVGADSFAEIGGDDHRDVAGGAFLTAGKGLDVDVGQNAALTTGQSAVINAGQTIHLKAGSNVVIEAPTGVSLVCGGNFVTVGPAGVDIKGMMVNINTGGAKGSGPGTKAKAAKKPTAPDEGVEPLTDQPGQAAARPAARPVTPGPFEVGESETAAAFAAARDAAAPLVAL